MTAYFIPSPEQTATAINELEAALAKVGSDASATAIAQQLAECRQEAQLAARFSDIEREACNEALQLAADSTPYLTPHMRNYVGISDLLSRLLHAVDLLPDDADARDKAYYFTGLMRKALAAT